MSVQKKYPHYLKDQKTLFDELITEDWESYKSEEWDYSRKFGIKRLFSKIKPNYILDIGCGCGFHDKIMAKYTFVRKINAIDYSKKSIMVANSVYPHSKVTRTVTGFENYKSDERYDLVVSFQVFEHLHNPIDFLKFCIEYCVPSGYIAIETINRLRLENILRLLKGMKSVIIDPMHYKEYTIKEIMKLGRNFGLKPFDSFGFDFNPSLFHKKLSIRERVLIGYYFSLIATRITVMFKKSKE